MKKNINKYFRLFFALKQKQIESYPSNFNGLLPIDIINGIITNKVKKILDNSIKSQNLISVLENISFLNINDIKRFLKTFKSNKIIINTLNNLLEIILNKNYEISDENDYDECCVYFLWKYMPIFLKWKFTKNINSSTILEQNRFRNILHPFGLFLNDPKNQEFSEYEKILQIEFHDNRDLIIKLIDLCINRKNLYMKFESFIDFACANCKTYKEQIIWNPILCDFFLVLKTIIEEKVNDNSILQKDL